MKRRHVVRAFSHFSSFSAPTPSSGIDTIDSAYYTVADGDGQTKAHAKQASMWVATHDLPRIAAHPFYAQLNQIDGGDTFHAGPTSALRHWNTVGQVS